ncbi:MAG: AraC family transcriptional regulator [Planctomycetota bacterium]
MRALTLHYREAGRGYHVKEHDHPAWQWYLCLHGAMHVQIDAEEITLGPYQSVFIPPFAKRALHSSQRRAPGYVVAVFDSPEVVLDAIARRRIDTPSALRPEVQAMVHELRHHDAPDARLLAEALLLRLVIAHKRLALAAVEPTTAPAVGDRTRQELVARAEAFMAKHLAEPLTRQLIAQAVHVSETHLARVFRAATGMTALDRLTVLRLEQASHLLRDSDLPIGEIVKRVGFVGFAHFSRTFKRAYSIAPSEYRATGGAAGGVVFTGVRAPVPDLRGNPGRG